tara:strand:- start:736 stop:939 length:204 start_codon:yes stop_codon:yes gene_type:complete
MTSYPPTTLPPSPPYANLDEIISVLCDRCLAQSDEGVLPQSEIDQFFAYTMALVDFWFYELETKSII